MKKNFFNVCSVILIISCILLNACKDNEIVMIQSNDGGDFLCINMTMNDTLKVSGALTISIGSTPILNAQNGDIIKLKW